MNNTKEYNESCEEWTRNPTAEKYGPTSGGTSKKFTGNVRKIEEIFKH